MESALCDPPKPPVQTFAPRKRRVEVAEPDRRTADEDDAALAVRSGAVLPVERRQLRAPGSTDRHGRRAGRTWAAPWDSHRPTAGSGQRRGEEHGYGDSRKRILNAGLTAGAPREGLPTPQGPPDPLDVPPHASRGSVPARLAARGRSLFAEPCCSGGLAMLAMSN